MRGGREKPFIDLPFGWLMTKQKRRRSTSAALSRAIDRSGCACAPPFGRTRTRRDTAKRWTNICDRKKPWPSWPRVRREASRGSWRRRSAPMPMRATRARSATSRAGTSTPTSVGGESVADSSVPRSAGPANAVARRWDPIVSSTTRLAFGRTSPSGTKSGNGSSISDDGWPAPRTGLGRREAASSVLCWSRRFEECADLGCGFSGWPRVEVGRQAAGIPRFEQASLQQYDRGPIPLAPDRTARGLEDLVHRREDVGVVVSLLESELAAVVVLQRFDLDVRGAEREAHDDDRREDVALVVDAFAERAALDGEQDRAAFATCDAQRLDRSIALRLRPFGSLDQDPLSDPEREEPRVGLFEQLVRRKEQGHVSRDRRGDCRDMMRHPVVHLRAPLRVQRREFGVDKQESIRLRERGPVGQDHASTEIDPQEVGVHLRRIERAGHEHARVHPVEHALAQDARVHQPEGELPLVAWDDEPENADVLLPPPGEEFRDLGQRRGEAAPDRVFAGEGDHLDEVRVSEGAAAAFREPFLDEVEELFLPGHALGPHDEQEVLSPSRRRRAGGPPPHRSSGLPSRPS